MFNEDFYDDEREDECDMDCYDCDRDCPYNRVLDDDVDESNYDPYMGMDFFETDYI